MIDKNLLNSRKFKTLKNIILTFKGREVFVYPYPILISTRLKENYLKDESEIDQVEYVYKGLPLYFYFMGLEPKPMFIKNKWDKLDDFLRDFLDESIKPILLSLDRYPSYLFRFDAGLCISPFSFFIYKLYSEMFDQSQLIMKNMNQDKENFFEGVEDIVIDISQPPYCEEFKDAIISLEESLKSDGFIDIQKFYNEYTYKCGLQEAKSILITHLSESAPYGYSGVDENFFKKYDHRLQLALICSYHQSFLFRYSCDLYAERSELRRRIYLWEPSPSSSVSHIHASTPSLWYVRSFHKKLRILFKL